MLNKHRVWRWYMYMYMHYSLMGKMRLPFIDSDLLYRGTLRQVWLYIVCRYNNCKLLWVTIYMLTYSVNLFVFELMINIHLHTLCLLTVHVDKDLYSRMDTNLALSRVARFYATTEQKFIHSFWNALRIRRKIKLEISSSWISE
jgi:hypothetical protein